MRYGHFDDAAREYVITTPRTPYPWINYLGSEEFFSLVSHTAGGYTFYRDARMRRLTRYRYNNIPNDAGGRYFYLNDGGDVWTPSWMPVKAELDSFEARHGMGYTRITGSRGGLTASVLYFVPLGRNAEVQQVTLTNDSAQAKSVGLFSFLEFALWNAHDDQTNYQRNLSLAEMEVELDGPYGSAIYHRTEYRERRDHYAVYGVNTRAAGFDTDRDTFVGAYNSLGEAAVPRAGVAADSVASGWYPIGSHHLAVDLAPGESRSFTFVLGYIENPREAKWAPADDAAGIAEGQVIEKSRAHELLSAFATEAQTDAAFAELQAYWDRLLVDLHGRVHRREARPDGQHLEPVPVHGDVQHVALGLVLRDRDRPGDGLPRLEPGPARLRAPGPRPRPRADPRHRRDAVPRRLGLPPVPAADQAREQRRRLRLQRRPAVADPRRRRLPQGDRGLVDPRRDGAVRQRRGPGRVRCSST